MELGLSLGSDASKQQQRPFNFLKEGKTIDERRYRFDIHTALSLNNSSSAADQQVKAQKSHENDDEEADDEHDRARAESYGDRSYGGVARQRDENENKNTSLQLNLLPLAAPRFLVSSAHVQSLPSSSDNDGSSQDGSSGNMNPTAAEGLSRRPLTAEEVSSANSVGSGFHNIIDLGIFTSNGHFMMSSNSNNKRVFEAATGNDVVEAERGASDDDDENGLNGTRKKLRLSKEQSAFLEESFKEHNTLNPKQKLALAKQLNLRPRQVEVWFQNRRARTKLKQTEVECEYLKRCCETLTEENRRLHKELQELRALKTASNPYNMQVPATTLTMCPSCERVATTSNSATGGKLGAVDPVPKAGMESDQFPPARTKRLLHPFPQSHSSQQHTTAS